MHIIELNDRNISLRNQTEVLVQSPGFANIVDKQVTFGDEARQIAKLHPRHTYNQFWSQLSLDPLVNSNNHFRHQADLAFAHLNEIASQHALKDEVIFAVPSNYNRNQLSILLGLVQSCEFDAVGLVDMPLLLAGKMAGTIAGKDGATSPAVYLDIQLHQSVLTTFVPGDGNVTRDKVVQIPGTGLIALFDAWANMVTDEFIKQSRFDPQHNAETEQYVHNQLGLWLSQVKQDNEILMEINNKGSVYQARVNRGHFEQRVRNIFGRVKEELESLAGNNFSLYLPDNHAELPGLPLYLNNISRIADGQLLENCLQHMDHIRGEPGSMNFITTLPLSGQTRDKKSDLPDSGPSHILVNNRAYPLPTMLQFGPVNGNMPSGSSVIQVEAVGGSGDLKISLTDDGAQLDVQGVGKVQLNGSKVSARELLKLGDIIKLPGSDSLLQLIQVE